MNSIPSTNKALQVVEWIFWQELEADGIVCSSKHNHTDVVDPEEYLEYGETNISSYIKQIRIKSALDYKSSVCPFYKKESET